VEDEQAPVEATDAVQAAEESSETTDE
jgi:hypothetical protein